MARVQTLVQLTDELVRLLDAQAAREGKSRSQVIRDALTAYTNEQRKAEIDAAIVAAYTAVPQTAEELAWGDAEAAEMIHEEPWLRS